MAKRRNVIKRIGTAARRAGLSWESRQGGSHEVFYLDGLRIPIPRHNELGPRTTETIFKECAAKLGKDWWR